MIFKKLIFFVILSSAIFASEYTLEVLKEKPKSLQRDFFISLLLDKKSLTPKEADEAYNMLQRTNWNLFKKYISLSENEEQLEKFRCATAALSRLLEERKECIEEGITLGKVLKTDRETLQKLYAKLQESSSKRELLRVGASENLYQSLLKSDQSTFSTIINGVGKNYREEHFNKNIPKEVWQNYDTNSWSFYQTIKLIVTNPNLNRLQDSLIGTNLKNAPHRALFFLALNELQRGTKEGALSYLDKIIDREDNGIYKDRATFWKYLITEDKKYLKKVVEYKNLPNLFSLAAYEILKEEPKFDLTFDIDSLGKSSGLDISDPFFWVEYRARIDSESNATKRAMLIDALRYDDSIGYLANTLYREHNFQKSYFVRPFEEYLEGRDAHKKALFYAILKQESLYLKTAVSTSYALGFMQVMPFNVDVVAKRRGEKIDYLNMFNPFMNFAYAEHILDEIIRAFKHPLFISYAYNGGWTFAKRVMDESGLFKKGKYSPYLDIELVDYDESRHYGKKVLANYVIYMRYFGEDISIVELLNSTIRE